MVTRKEKEIEFREKFIIDAAEKLFTEKGFENVTMEDIATRSEYTKPTLYKYFSSKKEILFSVYLRGWFDSSAKIEAAMKEQSNGYDKLKAIAAEYNQYFKNNPIYFSLLKYVHSKGIHFSDADDEKNRQYKKAVEDKISTYKEVIEIGLKDGSIASDIEPDVAVHFFMNNLYINMHTYHQKKDNEFLKKATRLMIKVFK